MKRLFGVFIFVVSAHLAQAEEKVDYVIQPEKEVIIEDSSAHHRIDKTTHGSIQVFGIGPTPLLNQGVNIGSCPNRNRHFYLSLLRGNSDLGFSRFNKNEHDITSWSLGLSARIFKGNSFNWTYGLNYSRIDYDFSRTGSSIEFKGDNLTAHLGVGNQWMEGIYTLGIQWIGVNVPLWNNTTAKDIQSNNPTVDDAKFATDRDFLIRKPSLNLFRLYVGTTF